MASLKPKVITRIQRKNQEKYKIMIEEKLPANLANTILKTQNEIKQKLKSEIEPKFNLRTKADQTWLAWTTSLLYSGLMLFNSNQDVRAKYIKSITNSTTLNNNTSNIVLNQNGASIINTSTHKSLEISNKAIDFLNVTEIEKNKYKSKKRTKRGLFNLDSKTITEKIKKAQMKIEKYQEKVQKQKFEWERLKDEPKQILVREAEWQAARKAAADANWRAAADTVDDLKTDLTTALTELDKVNEKLATAIATEEAAKLNKIEAATKTTIEIAAETELDTAITDFRIALAELDKAKDRLSLANDAEAQRAEEIAERTATARQTADKNADEKLAELLRKELIEAQKAVPIAEARAETAEEVTRIARQTADKKTLEQEKRQKTAREKLKTAERNTREIREELYSAEELATIRKEALTAAETELDTAAEKYQALNDPNKIKEWQKEYELSAEREAKLFEKYNEDINKLQEKRKKSIKKLQQQTQESNQDVKEKVKWFVDQTELEIEADDFTKSKIYSERTEALKELQEKAEQLGKEAIKAGDFKNSPEYVNRREAKQKYQEKIKQLAKTAEIKAQKSKEEKLDWENLIKRANEEQARRANQPSEPSITSNQITPVKTTDQIIIEKLAERRRQKQARRANQPSEQLGISETEKITPIICCSSRTKRSSNSPNCVPCPIEPEEKPTPIEPEGKSKISTGEKIITESETDVLWTLCFVNLIEPNQNITLEPAGDAIINTLPAGALTVEAAKLVSGAIYLFEGKQKITIEKISGTLGGCAGAVVGAEIGGAICTPIAPGVGTLICGMVGGLIGGVLGDFAASKGGKILGEIPEKWNKRIEEAADTMNQRLANIDNVKKMNATERKRWVAAEGKDEMAIAGNEAFNTLTSPFAWW